MALGMGSNLGRSVTTILGAVASPEVLSMFTVHGKKQKITKPAFMKTMLYEACVG